MNINYTILSFDDVSATMRVEFSAEGSRELVVLNVGVPELPGAAVDAHSALERHLVTLGTAVLLSGTPAGAARTENTKTFVRERVGQKKTVPASAVLPGAIDPDCADCGRQAQTVEAPESNLALRV